MNMNEKTWIAYGISKLDSTKFNKISMQSQHRPINKPFGGLWASPKNSDGTTDWYHWCEDEDFFVGDLKYHVEFKLRPNTNLYVIDNYCDFIQLKKNYPFRRDDLSIKEIDFEKLEASGYDGVYLTNKGLLEADGVRGLYGWDVESVVLFNLDCIEELGE
jgi:hypothetical protein